LKKTLYVAGCSHTAGDKHWGTSYSKIVLSHLPHFDFKDNSMHGKSNDAIFHDTIEYLNEHYTNHKKYPEYVIVQWSSPNRRVHQLDNGWELWVTPWDYTEYYLKDEPMASKHTIHYMWLLQNFLKTNNIDYVFINYFPLDSSIKQLHTFDYLDLNRYIHIDGLHPLFDGFIDYIRDNNLNADTMGHPNQEAYIMFTKLILDKLNIKYDLVDLAKYQNKI